MSREEAEARDAPAVYNYCPACQEPWRRDWMRRRGVHTCPLCEGPVIPRITRRAQAGESPWSGVRPRRAAG